MKSLFKGMSIGFFIAASFISVFTQDMIMIAIADALLGIGFAILSKQE